MSGAKKVKKVGCALGEEIDELRGKYHLKNKNSEAYMESSKGMIKFNEVVIGFLRQDNRRRRVILADHENGDEWVIKKVFKDDRKEDRLSLQRCTASEAIDEMDQKVCEGKKILNAFTYMREKRENRLEELQQELKTLCRVELDSPEQEQSDTNVTFLENALDKALIKYDTARIISRRYEDILDHLKEDSLTMPAKLDAMEQALLQQKYEKQELKVMSKDAILAKDETKRELSLVEQESYENRKKRDRELNALRKEVESRKAETEKVEKKYARVNLQQSDQQDQRMMLEVQAAQRNKQKILSYEEGFRKIMEATHVNCIEDVMERVTTQRETNAQLRGNVHELELQRNRLKEEVNKLTRQNHDLKYTGEQKLSNGERMLEKMKCHIEKEGARHDRMDDQIERNGNTLINIKTGMTTLMEKLGDVKLKPPLHSYTKGDVFQQIDLCRNKLNQLTRDVDNMMSLTSSDVTQQLQSQEFHDFLETQLSPENFRVKIEVSDTQLSEFDFGDGQENEVLSNADVKKWGQKLIDSKQKPKKRRMKKK